MEYHAISILTDWGNVAMIRGNGMVGDHFGIWRYVICIARC